MANFSLAGLNSMSDVGMQTLNTALSRVVAFALLLFIFYYSSTLFWRVFYPQEFKVPVSIIKALAPKPQPQMRWQWFADTDVKPAPKQAEVSKLDAKLVGVISQGDGKGAGGVALISVKGKPSEIFRIGDEVSNSRFVQSVGPDYVNLEFDGDIEVLSIKKYNVFSGEGMDEEEEKKGVATAKNKRLVEEFKEDISESPLKAMEFIKFEAAESDQGNGFKVSPQEDKHKELFSALGLEPGDIVVSANGDDIAKLKQNPADLDKLFDEGVTLQVVRDGILTDIYVY